jgi:hypothetical protein
VQSTRRAACIDRLAVSHSSRRREQQFSRTDYTLRTMKCVSLDTLS